jgi:hypothetical protein
LKTKSITLRFAGYIISFLTMVFSLGCGKSNSDALIGKWKSAEILSGEYGNSLITLELRDSGSVTMVTEFLELDSKFISSGTFVVSENKLTLKLTKYWGEDAGQAVDNAELDQVEIEFIVSDLNSNNISLVQVEGNQKITFFREE